MKRILLAVAAFMAIAVGAVWFAAGESYVLDLKADVATALDVSPHGELDWGTVFTQKTRTASITVALSSSALAETKKTCLVDDPANPEGPQIEEPCPNLTGVQYSIGCNAAEDANLDICQYVTVKPPTGTPALDNASPSRTHIIRFTAPTCEGTDQKVQKAANSPVTTKCDQDNAVTLTGEISVARLSLTGNEPKCDVTDKKGEVTECDPEIAPN